MDVVKYDSYAFGGSANLDHGFSTPVVIKYLGDLVGCCAMNRLVSSK